MKLRVEPITVIMALLAAYWVAKDVVIPQPEQCYYQVQQNPDVYKWGNCDAALQKTPEEV